MKNTKYNKPQILEGLRKSFERKNFATKEEKNNAIDAWLEEVMKSEIFGVEEKILAMECAEELKEDTQEEEKPEDAQETENEEMFVIVDENDNVMFGGQTYNEAAANRVWNMYNGIYEDENGERYIYIKRKEERKEVEKPESLDTVTVGQTREKYRQNVKAFNNIMSMVSTGTMEDLRKISGEWPLNRAMAEMIVQQEYIREREKANWGWDRGVADFSKQGSCIL